MYNWYRESFHNQAYGTALVSLRMVYTPPGDRAVPDGPKILVHTLTASIVASRPPGVPDVTLITETFTGDSEATVKAIGEAWADRGREDFGMFAERFPDDF